MEVQLFCLTNAEDDDQVYAWGMEITDGDKTEAVVYRRDPATKRAMFGVHDSAQAALRRYGVIHNLALSWEV